MEAEFKLPDTLDFSLSFPPYSHFLSFYLSMPESVASLMQKKTKPLIHYRIQATHLNTFPRL